MIDLEEHLRAVVSDIIAEAFGTNHKDYLQKNNYRDKKVRDPYYSRENILESLTRLAENSHKEPIQYYRRKYGFVPPWILFKGAYFGTLINFIRLLKKPQRDKLVYALYGNKQVTQENIDSFKDLLVRHTVPYVVTIEILLLMVVEFIITSLRKTLDFLKKISN